MKTIDCSVKNIVYYLVCIDCPSGGIPHSQNYKDISKVQIYFLDFCEEPGSKEDGYPALRHLEEQWMVQMGSLGALDPVQGWNKRDDAKAGARSWGT